MLNRVVGRAVAVVGVVLSMGPHAVASTAIGGGPIRAFDGVQVVGLPDVACTSSTAFAEVPGMTLKFDQDARGPVVVQFQGQFGGFSSTPNARAVLRFIVDGAVVGSAIAVANDHGTGADTFGFNAFSGLLAEGSHELKVLWHTAGVGATSCVEERSLLVFHP